MPTIPDEIRSGQGEFSSSSLLRDGVRASGPVMFSNDRLAAADRIDSLEAEIHRLRAALIKISDGDTDNFAGDPNKWSSTVAFLALGGKIEGGQRVYKARTPDPE